MPASPEGAITRVLQLASIINPSSVLDIGCGFGVYGFLMRVQMESVRVWPNDWSGRSRPQWRLRIDGAELHEPYVGDVHRTVYNEIHIGDIREKVSELHEYDMVFMGNLIEHLPKDDGHQLIDMVCRLARKAVVLVTPFGFAPFDDSKENEGQRHLSGWLPSDFKAYPGACAFVEDLCAANPRLVMALCMDNAVHRRVKRRLSRLRNLVRHSLVDLLGPQKGTQFYIKLRDARRKMASRSQEN